MGQRRTVPNIRIGLKGIQSRPKIGFKSICGHGIAVIVPGMDPDEIGSRHCHVVVKIYIILVVVGIGSHIGVVSVGIIDGNIAPEVLRHIGKRHAQRPLVIEYHLVPVLITIWKDIPLEHIPDFQGCGTGDVVIRFIGIRGHLEACRNGVLNFCVIIIVMNSEKIVSGLNDIPCEGHRVSCIGRAGCCISVIRIYGVHGQVCPHKASSGIGSGNGEHPGLFNTDPEVVMIP